MLILIFSLILGSIAALTSLLLTKHAIKDIRLNEHNEKLINIRENLVRYLFLTAFFTICIFSLYNRYGLSFTFFEKICFCFFIMTLGTIDLYSTYLPNNLLFAFICCSLYKNGFYNIYPYQFYITRTGKEFFSLSHYIYGGIAGFLVIAFVKVFFEKILKLARNKKERTTVAYGDAIFMIGVGFFVGIHEVTKIILIGALLGSLINLFLLSTKYYVLNRNLGNLPLPFTPFLGISSLLIYIY